MSYVRPDECDRPRPRGRHWCGCMAQQALPAICAGRVSGQRVEASIASRERASFAAPAHLSPESRELARCICSAANCAAAAPGSSSKQLTGSARRSLTHGRGRRQSARNPRKERRSTTNPVTRPRKFRRSCASIPLEPGVEATCVWGHYTAMSPGSLSRDAPRPACRSERPELVQVAQRSIIRSALSG